MLFPYQQEPPLSVFPAGYSYPSRSNWKNYFPKEDFRNHNPQLHHHPVDIFSFTLDTRGSVVKNLPAKQETQARFLGQEDPLKEGMAIHSSILAWRIPWREEPGRLQSIGSQRVTHDQSDWPRTHQCLHGIMMSVKLLFPPSHSLPPSTTANWTMSSSAWHSAGSEHALCLLKEWTNKLRKPLWFVDSQTGDCQIWSGTTQRLKGLQKCRGLWQGESPFSEHPCPPSFSQYPLQLGWGHGTRSQRQGREKKQCVSGEAASVGGASPHFLSSILLVESEKLQGRKGQIPKSAFQESWQGGPFRLQWELEPNSLVFSFWDGGGGGRIICYSNRACSSPANCCCFSH